MRLTLQQMQTTLTFSRGRYGRQFTSAWLRPFGLASLGLSRGSKTNDESFANYTQLSPVLMPLRIRSGTKAIKMKDPKPVRVKSQKIKRFAALSYKSKKLRHYAWGHGLRPCPLFPGPFGPFLRAPRFARRQKLQNRKALKAKALRCAQLLKSFQ